MAAKTLNQHAQNTPGVAGGKPRIADCRITVQSIVIRHERLGMSPDEIGNEYDPILADIHAVLAYYLDHREDIDRAIEQDNAFAEALRQRLYLVLAKRWCHISRHRPRGRQLEAKRDDREGTDEGAD